MGGSVSQEGQKGRAGTQQGARTAAPRSPSQERPQSTSTPGGRNREPPSDEDSAAPRDASPIRQTRAHEESSNTEGAGSPKTAPPRLATMPEEEMKQYAKGPNSKLVEKQLVRTVADAQKSWGNVWKNLHASPGNQGRGKLEMNLQQYYQGALCSLSHDVPLVY